VTQNSLDDVDEWNNSPLDHVVRFVLLILIVTGFALACGVAISGRVEVGDRVGEPATPPCPQAIE